MNYSCLTMICLDFRLYTRITDLDTAT